MSFELCNQILKRESSNFSIEIPNLKLIDGQRIAILGENGSGKSTIINSFFRRELVNKGKYFLDNKSIDCIDHNFLKQNFSILLSNFPPAWGLTVAEVIQISNSSLDSQKLNKMLQLFGFTSFLKREFNHLSDGQKKIVMLIKIFSSAKRFIVLDEPTTFLDSENTIKFGNCLEQIENKSLLLTSHDIGFCLDNTDFVYLINDNRLSEPMIIEDYILQLESKKSLIIAAKDYPQLSFLDEKLEMDLVTLKLFRSYFSKIFKGKEEELKESNFIIKASKNSKDHFELTYQNTPPKTFSTIEKTVIHLNSVIL